MNTFGIIVTVLAIAVFFYLWYNGSLIKIRDYVAETQEELRKCTWPSREELTGSTALVLVTMALLGVFTVSVDFVLRMVNHVIR